MSARLVLAALLGVGGCCVDRFVPDDHECWSDCVKAATHSGLGAIENYANDCVQLGCRGHWEKRCPGSQP